MQPRKSSTQHQARSFAKRPLVIAHRGGSLEAPENTVEALVQAQEVGSDWQEIDVGLSRDLHPVVIHDETLERTTNGQGEVSNQTLAELQQLCAGRPTPSIETLAHMREAGVSEVPQFGNRYSAARVPSLKRVLAETRGRLMIELKASDAPETLAQQVVAAVQSAGAEHRVVLGSFSLPALCAVYAAAPTLALVAITEELTRLSAWQQLPLRAVAVHTGLVAQARAQLSEQIPVWAWTCYSVEQAQQCAQNGAEGLITDVPRALVQALSSAH